MSISLTSRIRTAHYAKDMTSPIKAAAKNLLPDVLIEELRRYRRYTGAERAVYLKIRALNAVGIKRLKKTRPPKSSHRYLFVCFGNIMRSPVCEALMKRAVSSWRRKITVRSAGLNAIPGRAAHPWAIAAGKELGVSLESHRAQAVNLEMVAEAEVILAMDYQNLVQLLSRYPEARNKVFMLSAYAGHNYPSQEIGDPYYSDENGTRECYRVLERCVRNLVASISDD